MFKQLIFCLALVFTFGISASLQSSCSCSVGNGGCSASQSRPAPSIAICTCGASGCSSYCSGFDLPDGLTESGISKAVKSAKPSVTSEYLSKSLGKTIVLKPASAKFVFNEKTASAQSKSHWDLLTYLNTQGKVTVNGHDLNFWSGMRNTLTAGGPFKVCAGNATAQAILNEVNFISGRNYRIIGGDPSVRMEGTIEGNNISELLNNLSMTSRVMITDK